MVGQVNWHFMNIFVTCLQFPSLSFITVMFLALYRIHTPYMVSILQYHVFMTCVVREYAISKFNHPLVGREWSIQCSAPHLMSLNRYFSWLIYYLMRYSSNLKDLLVLSNLIQKPLLKQFTSNNFCGWKSPK